MPRAALLNAVAARLRADPVAFGAGLQAVVGGVGTLILLPLRDRGRAYIVFSLSLVFTILSVLLFVATLRSAAPPPPRGEPLLFAPDVRMWTFLRQMPHRTWFAACAAALTLLFIYVLLHTLAVPMYHLLCRRFKLFELRERTLDESTQNVSRCLCNRAYVNVAVLFFVVIAALSFSAAVVSTRVSLPINTLLTKQQADASAARSGFVKVPRLQKCVCNGFGRCEGIVDTITCSSALTNDLTNDKLFQCVTGVRDMAVPDQERIIEIFDKCVEGPNGPKDAMQYVTTILILMAAGCAVPIVLFAVRVPLLYTLVFLTVAYVAMPIFLAMSLPFMLSFTGGPAQQTYGLRRLELFLAAGSAPESVRLARIAVSAFFAQIAIMFCACMTEFPRYTQNLTVYALIGVRPVVEPFEDEGYKYDQEDLER